MDSRDPLFGQSDSPAVLPIARRLSGTSPSPVEPTQPPQLHPQSSEEFHLVDHTGWPLYELQPLGGPSAPVVSVSETGQVRYSQMREGNSLKSSFTWCLFFVTTADSDFSNKVELSVIQFILQVPFLR